MGLIERILNPFCLLLIMAKTTKTLKTSTTTTNGPVTMAKAPQVTAETPKAPAPGPNRVCLELIKPEAKKVCVAGSFNQWKPETTPLMPKGNGRWVGDLAVKPGRHEYLFVVDGQWVTDPNAKESVQNPFGGQNSVMIVSA
jgi:1,4-alpha-glucan branching enzyme